MEDELSLEAEEDVTLFAFFAPESLVGWVDYALYTLALAAVLALDDPIIILVAFLLLPPMPPLMLILPLSIFF